MTDAAKTRADVLADPRAFDAAYSRARKLFMTFPGVVGVGIGQKQAAGKYHENIAIVVFVMEKKTDDAIPPPERIPPTFEGYPTDVRVVQQSHLHACDNTAEFPVIQGGIQLSQKANQTNGHFESGTLACIVRKRNDGGRDNVYLLSNKHVLFQNNVSGVGDYIYHPFSPAAPGFVDSGPVNSLGPIQPASFFGNESFTRDDPAHPGTPLVEQYFVDCAVARLDLDSKCCDSTCTKDKTPYDVTIIDLRVNGVDKANTIADVNDVRFGQPAHDIIGKKVFKVGRTTGKTTGIVRLTNVAHLIAAFPPLGTPAFTAQNTIEIDFDTTSSATNCKGHAWFSELGDSGALIVDEQFRAVGLISAGPGPGFPNASPDHACHIVPILDKLGICIPCASGTSHGSSGATDGSGLQPAATSPADSKLPDGKIVFTGAEAETLPGFAPRPLSDEAAVRMGRLLDAFLATSRGPELREAFASVRREVGYLVRNVKQVTVAWHKHRGPAFLAHAINQLFGDTGRVPREIDGVTRRAMLVRMGEVLHKYGSRPLQEALDTYGNDILAMNEDCDSVDECVDWLGREAAVTR